MIPLGKVPPLPGGARVSHEVVDPMGRKKSSEEELREVLAKLGGALGDVRNELRQIRQRMAVSTDWSRDYDHNTNVAGITQLLAGKELGTSEEPFRSLTVISVGGGSLRISINRRRPVAVVAGDVFRDEKIWSVDIDTSAQAAGTAIVRLTASLGG